MNENDVAIPTLTRRDLQTKVQDVATQMGAVHKLDLTGDVTHLLVGCITTPKYQYVAKERPDIKVLQPEWLEAVREAWIEAEEIDMAAIDKRYRLRPFYGLKICVTGFDNLEQRTYLSETVVQQGAEYHGDLTKQVTHLIAKAPEGAKFRHALSWPSVKIVSLRWFEDSLRRGMALDESLYDPVMPLEEQGKDAFRTVPLQRTSLGKRSGDDEAQAVEDVSKRKLRRTASTRLNSQSQDMWQDMSVRDDDSGTVTGDQWTDETNRKSHEESTRPRTARTEVRRSDVFPQMETDEEPQGLFAGLFVLIFGFEDSKRDRLREYLEPNGAIVVKSTVQLEDASCNAFYQSRYLLVPHAASDPPMKLPAVPVGTQIVTEWWLERCIHYKRVIDPAVDRLSQPFWDAALDAFSGLNLSGTGFDSVDLRQTAKVVGLMGATYIQGITPSLSAMISATDSVRQEKSYYAAKHDIPVVSVDWLWQCLRQRKKVPFDGFKLRLPIVDLDQIVPKPSASSQASSDLLRRRAQGAEKV